MESLKLKGLQNKGENNCFINVVVQLLFSIKQARESILSNTHNHPITVSCLTCELSNLFTQMIYSDISNFSTSNLRLTLISQRLASSEFQELEMGCAVEAFEEVLNVLHSESPKTQEDLCTDLCTTHKFFGFQYLEEKSCCDEFEIGNIEKNFLMRVYARDLERAYNNLKQTGQFVDFNDILGFCLADAPTQNYCMKCGKEIKGIRRWISTPKVWALSIVWDPAGCMFSRHLIRCFNEFLYSKAIYVAEDGQDIDEKYIFRGIVCFQYSHYCAFIYEVQENAWYQVDDNVIRKVQNFSSIIKQMNENNSLPVLLLYEVFTPDLQSKYVSPSKEDSDQNRSCFNCEIS